MQYYIPTKYYGKPTEGLGWCTIEHKYCGECGRLMSMRDGDRDHVYWLCPKWGARSQDHDIIVTEVDNLPPRRKFDMKTGLKR